MAHQREHLAPGAREQRGLGAVGLFGGYECQSADRGAAFENEKANIPGSVAAIKVDKVRSARDILLDGLLAGDSGFMGEAKAGVGDAVKKAAKAQEVLASVAKARAPFGVLDGTFVVGDAGLKPITQMRGRELPRRAVRGLSHNFARACAAVRGCCLAVARLRRPRRPAPPRRGARWAG